MPRDTRAWLWDIQQAAKRVSRFLDGHDLPSYQSSDLGACRTWGVEAKFGPSEDSFRRICSPIAVAIWQKAGEKWTAAAKLQPTFPKSDRLLVRSAVETQFEIIGEALSQLGKHSPELAAAVPHWREIIGFRNMLIHGYATIDDTRVWRIAQIDLPPMAQAVDQLLGAP